MIPKFAEQFRQSESELRKAFAEKHPEDYMEIVTAVVKHLPGLDVNRIHEIDDGSCQGTLIYLIAEEGYQPHEYVSARVWYGSCSGCDTLEGIRYYSNERPTAEQVDDYIKLARDIVSSMCWIGGKDCHGETVLHSLGAAHQINPEAYDEAVAKVNDAMAAIGQLAIPTKGATWLMLMQAQGYLDDAADCLDAAKNNQEEVDAP